MKEQFDNLKIQLELLEWPRLYMYKFIVPNTPEMIAKVGNLFSAQAEINIQPSKNGNFASITGKEVMMSVEDTLEVYYKAAEFKGVIAL